ncbi:MAG: reverse transcriptase domain-containing protein [Pseudomonadota bacterium]
MTATPKPASLFQSTFTRANLREIFDEFISDGAAVGRDGVSVEKFSDRIDSEMDIILRKVNDCSYEFTAYREKLISKGALKPPRQISIPTVRDKIVLKYLSEFLAKIYPDHVSRVPHSTIKRVHEVSSSRLSSDNYLRLDIESYFPSIDHRILLRILRRRIRKKQLLHLLENALITPTGRKKTADTLNECGIAQGLSISNILSSIYLADIDTSLSQDPNVEYIRFVDDILMIGSQVDITSLAVSTPRLLKSKRKIKCHTVGDGSKSVIVPLADGIDYLGYRFRLSEIEVREASFKKMFSNIIRLVSAMKYANNKGPLIWKLNLRISGCQFLGRKIGWLFFFSQSKNTQQLKQLDAFVNRQASMVLSPADQGRLKRFVKAYHEIRFNADQTRYFPNFDDFDDEQKRHQIGILIPKKTSAEIGALSPAELDQLFRKCINREIADLEKDMMEAFS